MAAISARRGQSTKRDASTVTVSIGETVTTSGDSINHPKILAI